MTQSAMASYGALGSNEVWNAARLKAYVDAGIKPAGFNIMCHGCAGLEDILPCVTSDPPPLVGYRLPELDEAPWYDERVPESANFAGLLVTSVTISGPYSRSVTQNITNGQTLGRLRLNGRTIVVHGFLIGKTACAAQYGLNWLTSVLDSTVCADPAKCGVTDFDFLDCCPTIGEEPDDCLVTCVDGQNTTYVRPDSLSEYQRAQDFWRRMHGVGVTDGPNIISCRGGGCGGCGSKGSIMEVEFTLQTESPYVYGLADEIFRTEKPCDDSQHCDITWFIKENPTDPCPDDEGCPKPVDCLDDPLCPTPPLPPVPVLPTKACGCKSMYSDRVCTAAASIRDWGSSTLNFIVYAGSKDLRNVGIRVWQNPLGFSCDDRERFPDCAACATLLITYVPAGGTLEFSGEYRTVTITCNGVEKNGAPSVTTIDGQPFAWPDIDCMDICACVEFDCAQTADDATVIVERVNRDLF